MRAFALGLTAAAGALAASAWASEGMDLGFGDRGFVAGLAAAPSSVAATSLSVDSAGRALVAVSGSRNGTVLARFGVDGEADPSFGLNGVAAPAGLVDVRVVRHDVSGRILVAADGCVARLLPSGTLDAAFGTGGRSGRSGQVLDVREDSSGALVGVEIPRVLLPYPPVPKPRLFRLTSDGHPDPAFGDNGIVELAGPPTSIALSPAGRVLLLSRSASGWAVVEARSLSGGALDPTFGSGGRALVPSLESVELDLEVGRDGSVFVGGRVPDPGSSSGGRLAAVKLDRAGRPDLGFGVDGVARTDALVLRATTSIVPTTSGGLWLVSVPAESPPAGAYSVVARLAADGSADGSFAPGGTQVVTIGKGASGSGALAAEAPDGKLLVAGYLAACGWYLAAVVRLDGARLDERFGAGGVLASNLGLAVTPTGTPVTILPSGAGRVLLTFSSSNGGDPVYVLQLGRDGRLDPAFGQGGQAPVRFSACPPPFDSNVSEAGSATAVAIGPNGSIHVLVALSEWAGPAQFVLIRLRADGQVDRRFGADGRIALSPSDEPYLRHMAIGLDGRILLARKEGGVPRVVGLLADGRVDPGFAPAPLPPGLELKGLSVDEHGRIVLAGTELSPAPERFVVVRLLPDGRLDPSFGAGGLVRLSFPSSRADIMGALALGAGRIVVAGWSRLSLGTSSRPVVAVAVLLDDGSPAAEFGQTGLVNTPIPGNGLPLAALLQPDGRIVVAGARQSHEAFALRYLRNGQPDPSFGPGGLLALRNTAAEENLFGSVLGIAMPEPGRLVLSGQLFKPPAGFAPGPETNGLPFLVGLSVTTPVELLSFRAD